MSHWNGIYGGHLQQEPASPRFAQIAGGVRTQLGELDGRVLLLGVTPMLSTLGTQLTGVDRNQAIVRTRWIGNAPGRCAVVADWRQLPFAPASFSACIGDGSINAMAYQSVGSVYQSLAVVMRTGSRLVCRVYLTPDPGETVSDVRRAVLRGECSSFLYFKFRLGMAIAAERSEPSVAVQSIHAVFQSIFPNRQRLVETVGWDRREIDKIDLYKSSPEIYNFPTRPQTLAIVPPVFANARFIPVGDYELADRCPLLVMDKT